MQQTSSTSSSRRRHLLGSVVFLLGLAVLLGAVQFVVLPRHDRDKLWMDYRDLPRNSVDVLFLGTSLVHANINPTVMWEKTGIRAYDLSGSEQSLLTTLPYLKEALKTQRPKVVVMDLHMLSNRDLPLSENQKRSNLTMMPLGIAKFGAIGAATPAAEWPMYLIPIQQFHSRWNELKRKDFRPSKWRKDDGNFYLGYRMGDKVVPQQPSPERRDFNEELYTRNYRVVSDVIDVAENADAEVLLMVGPSSLVHLHDAWIARLQTDLKRDHPEVRVLEAQVHTQAMGVDYRTDYYDKLHLNRVGAEKYSAWLGGLLANWYDLPRDSSGELDGVWRKELARYRKSISD